MKLLRIQFLQSTACSQARLRIDNGEKQSMTVPYDYEDVTKQKNELATQFGKRFYPELNVRNVGDYKGQTFFELFR